MADSLELLRILDRILGGSASNADIALLRQSLAGSSSQNVVQLGKYNVNIGEGKDIHIGDKVYQGADAQTIRSILLEILSHNTRQIEINWHDVSQDMLSEQQRLTTNPLTSPEGISYRTEQVYVPLGLVERKKQTRRREDVSPEEGSSLYRETEITQTFEHQQFLEQVLKQRQSPKSRGRRIAIIGEPGAGKTTLLQQIARWVSLEMAQSVVIWVSLADLRSHELESYLLEVWLQAVARKVGQAEASTQVKDDFVAQFNQGLVWLLLDGVDEMQATLGNPLGEIERQIRTGTLLQQARIVVSCRLNLWDSGSNALDSFDNYRTLEFSYPQQVEQFIGNWFGSLQLAETQTGQRLCAALKEQGKERIRDLAKNPLRLTLLCFNWYLGEGKLPQTKAGLYEQFVADFYVWKKGLFATTGEERKRLNAALGELAREAIDKEATRFRLRQEFVCEYLGEPDDAGSLFWLALRLGWLNKVGVDGNNPRKGVYAFFHPTFQEYFAAKNFCNDLDWQGLISNIAQKHWREVFILSVEILPNPDQLLLSMKAKIDGLLADAQKFQQFLDWVLQKGRGVNLPYKPAMIRAIYFSEASGIFRRLFFITGHGGSGRSAIADYGDYEHSESDRIDDSYSLDDLSLALAIEPKLNKTTSEFQVLNVCQSAKEELDVDSKLFIGRENLLQNVKKLFKELIPRPPLIPKIARYNWHLSEEEKAQLEQYYYANKLLMDCLGSTCAVSETVRRDIEETLLLPLIEVEKQKRKN